ncbi:MAG TPA: hypothetical protein VGN20_01140 [Mucilaginibacter sp.]|jgi:hypothetical protein
MKKFTLLTLIAITAFNLCARAQIQAGNILIGTDIADLNFGLNSPNVFSANLSPKAAWFIQDNVALGGYVKFGIQTQSGQGSTINYGVGALGRYYQEGDVNVIKHGRLFGEATAGIGGISVAQNGGNTNGFDFSVGPGFAYFVTPTLGLEALLKYNGILGFGSTAYQNNLNLSFGFQIYLPGKATADKLKQH